MRFVLNGCDISFVAEAPADITLEQLLRQCDKIRPYWCACGICSIGSSLSGYGENAKTEILIDYDCITKTDEDVPCCIEG